MAVNMDMKDGYLYGAWRQPVNIQAHMKGSIHDDKTAQKLGMRGGTISGNIHLEQFVPLLLEVFGKNWFECGTLSIYYTYATKDREPVRAIIGIPPENNGNTQVEVRMETRDGHTVCKGTASIGHPEAPTALRALTLENALPSDLRILAGFKAGDTMPASEVVITPEQVSERLEVMTEPHDWYSGGSPWGGAIATPMLMFNAMRADLSFPVLAVSFLGAAELRNVAGPVKAGVPYLAGGELLCLGVTPKTEFYWFDAYLDEKESGQRIAEMRIMRRFMKASSKLYQDQ